MHGTILSLSDTAAALQFISAMVSLSKSLAAAVAVISTTYSPLNGSVSILPVSTNAFAAARLCRYRSSISAVLPSRRAVRLRTRADITVSAAPVPSPINIYLTPGFMISNPPDAAGEPKLNDAANIAPANTNEVM